MNAGPENYLNKIAEDSGIEISGFSPLTGGDINQVFLLESDSGKYVVKLNNAKRYPDMFEAEKLGLEKLLEPGVIDVPKPLRTGQVDAKSYLLLEHKPSGNKASDFWEIFGRELARLHQHTSDKFGLEKDNYIGSLPQYNEERATASAFYIEMRLQPQIKMARDRGFDLNVSDSFFRNCEEIIPREAPALVHGDLWNGNYLVNAEGLPCLIDPAVALAPREMDIGMMHLFGGFQEPLFEAYNAEFPLQAGWEQRIPLWQLYYLLVHLNIFGASYKSQVTSIIRKYS
ncbi:fructosamine kinase family protein [Pontixanthobacter gangjinensis]|uniref:Fructosamine kinase family protein n=1 Tax=Christiangramia aestuarii TaxID=1028746 RepID=A0A7K1LMI6_9FLAO|nr:fructosamine kinase family protein [Christiangramia aestuarii]MUP42022.1 fructosamine kinase family protein [Christiangramia aestuarii]